MAIVSIFADNAADNNPTEILALNEEHFIFDSDYTFLHFEFIAYLHKNAKNINILLHGDIIPHNSDEYKKSIRTNYLYDKYIINFLNDKVGAVADIISFAKTFIRPEQYETNCHYEPPQEKIIIDELCEKYNQTPGINGLKFKLYEEHIIAPNVKFEYSNNGQECSFVKICKNDDKDFEAKTPYGFRIGLWLKSLKTTGDVFNWATLRFKYDIHFYCLEESVMEHCLNNWGFKEKRKYSRLWTKIDPRKECGIKTIIKAFNEQKAPITLDTNFDHIAEKLSMPHTDVWVLLPQRWDLTAKDILLRGKNPRYILYTPIEEVNIPLPFTQYHRKVSQVLELSYYCITCKHPYLKKLKLEFTIKRITRFWRPFIRHLIVYLSLPVFLLLVILNMRLKVNEYLLNQDYCLALCLYLAAFFIDAVFSHRDFIEQFLITTRNSQKGKWVIAITEKIGIKKYLSRRSIYRVIWIALTLIYVGATFWSFLFVKQGNILKLESANIIAISAFICTLISLVLAVDSFKNKDE